MRILLIEDEDSIRSALTRACERDGHEVRPAASLGEAREVLAGWAPELAISDLKLPDGDGLSLVGTLGLPFVMLSGYATYDDAVRALRCGAVDFFTKPVSIKDVRAAIARAKPAPEHPQATGWSDPDGALAAVRTLVSRLPGPLARLAAAELVQAVPAGHLHVQDDQHGVRLWLDAAGAATMQDDRCAWLRAWGATVSLSGLGIIVDAGVERKEAYNPDQERLWPEELVLGRPVQVATWRWCGSWILAALRSGAGPLVGLDPRLRTSCEACGVSVSTAPDSLIRCGVGGAERAGLLGADGLGAPIA